MNILYISHEKDLNGASLSLLGLIDELKEKCTIFVLSPYNSGSFVNELHKRNIEVISIPYYRWRVANKNKKKWICKVFIYNFLELINYISLFRLQFKLKQYNIDIIHTNTSVIHIGGLISKRLNIPHVWHIREFGQEDFNMDFIRNEKKSLEFMNKTSQKVVFISKAIEFKYQQYFDKEKSIMIYNGLDHTYINNSCNIKKTDDVLLLLIAGRLEDAKGQKEAILALNHLINQGKNKIVLYIAGIGENESILKNMVIDLGIEEYVVFLGKMKSLQDIRNKVHVELVCSKSEAFGRVTIEAMLNKNPVIGANTGATKELVINEYNGWLYNQGDYSSLASRISKFYDNKKLAQKMGYNAYLFAKNNFLIDNTANQIMKLYKDLQFLKK